MKTGIELIKEERDEQLFKHCWSSAKDSQYEEGELVDAAMQYLAGDDARHADGMLRHWPISWDRKWYKPGNRLEELKKAGALIAAEIDRINFEQSKPKP